MSQVVLTLLIAGGIIAVIGLVGVILYLFSKETFFKALSFFVMDNGKAEESDMKLEQVKLPEKKVQKSKAKPSTELCKLISKSDDRLRTIDNLGVERIVDSYYELVFVTRKKEKLYIACSAEAYDNVPFDSEGELTYRRNTLVRFRYYNKKDEFIINN